MFETLAPTITSCTLFRMVFTWIYFASLLCSVADFVFRLPFRVVSQIQLNGPVLWAAWLLKSSLAGSLFVGRIQKALRLSQIYTGPHRTLYFVEYRVTVARWRRVWDIHTWGKLWETVVQPFEECESMFNFDPDREENGAERDIERERH